jgi:cobalt-zinc-cadmium resistance protein CzcA
MLLYLKRKENILLMNDSLYAVFLEKANARFEKGESNVLEKKTAETQRGQIAVQLAQLRGDVETTQMRFKLLLNSTSNFVPVENGLNTDFSFPIGNEAITTHPGILALKQQNEISLAKTRLEKSKMLPNLNLAYSTMSMKGAGSDNVNYNSSIQFNSLQFGIGLPLFFGSQKAKINSSRTQELISENNYQVGLQEMMTAYETALKRYEVVKQTLNYFETTAVPDADTIVMTANQLFSAGEINYLEWTMLVNSAASIRSNYADALRDFNLIVNELNFLNSK